MLVVNDVENSSINWKLSLKKNLYKFCSLIRRKSRRFSRVFLVLGSLDRLTVKQNLGCLVLLGNVARRKSGLLGTCDKSSLGLLLLFFFLLILIIASLVFLDTVEEIVGENAKDQEEPEQVHGLQTGQQRKRNVLTDPALVLLRFPVKFKRSNGPEFSQDSPKDLEVEIMPAIDPHTDEACKVGRSDNGVEIVESLRGLQG